MKYRALLPSQALDLAYRRQKVSRTTLDAFEAARKQFLTELDAQQDEADIAEPMRRFLRGVGFANFINSRKKRDLVLHSGPDASDPLGHHFRAEAPEEQGGNGAKE